MRRHASSLAFFVGGFLVALAIIQVSHAQSRTAPPVGSVGGSPVIDTASHTVVTQYGNKLYAVPLYEFEQSKVRSVTLK